MNYLNREFDKNGLLLAEYQAKLFERSVDEIGSSSAMFIRKFSKSELANDLDLNESVFVDPEVRFGIERLIKEFTFKANQKSTVKYNKEAMFWMGYMYRYICYTRNIPTSLAIKLFDYKMLYSNYYVYHTQSPEWVISNLLDNINETESIFDINYRYIQAYKKYYSIA